MNDTLSTSMFWVGALMVAAPLLFFGVVIGVWWYQRKKAGEVGQAGKGGEVARPPRLPR